MLLRRFRRSSSPPCSRAHALIARGQLLDALELLTAANRQRRSPEIEQQLVDLRYRAFGRIGHPDVPSPPPVFDGDPFPGVVGLPEIAADRLTPELLCGAILSHGSLVVRGLVSPPRVETLVAAIDRVFAAYDAHERGAPTAETGRWFAPRYTDRRYRAWNRQTGAFLVIDSPAVMFDVLETFEEAGLRAVITRYFGERPALLARKWTLRRVSHDAPMGDWHQDGAFMGKDIRSLNVWLALSHCGDDAPGLEIVGRRLEDIVATGTDGAFFDWSVGAAAVERASHGSIAHPIFEPGDAVFFDHMNLHRTVVEPRMTRDRYAIESWFLAPSSYPAMVGYAKKTLVGRRPKGQLPIVF